MYNMKKERSYWEGTHAANRRIMYLAAGYEQEDIVKSPTSVSQTRSLRVPRAPDICGVWRRWINYGRL